MTAIDDIAAERKRQIDVEGWTPEHDKTHAMDRSLLKAAICYARHALAFAKLNGDVGIEAYRDLEETFPKWGWPRDWDRKWWKPKDPRRDLVRAAALIVAEIDRMDADPMSCPIQQDTTPESATARGPVSAGVSSTSPPNTQEPG